MNRQGGTYTHKNARTHAHTRCTHPPTNTTDTNTDSNTVTAGRNTFSRLGNGQVGQLATVGYVRHVHAIITENTPMQ